MKPRPPKPPTPPAKPERIFQRLAYHRIDIESVNTLRELLNRVPPDIDYHSVTIESECDYESQTHYLQYATTTIVTLDDSAWTKALQRYDAALIKHEQKLVEYATKLATYQNALKTSEEQERALLTQLQAKYAIEP